VAAGNCIDQLKSAGVENVGSTDYLPIGTVNPDGTFTGILPDVIAAANKTMGLENVKIQGVSLPFGSLIPGLTSGRITITGDTMTPTDERKKQVDFLDNLWYIRVDLMVPKGNPKNLHSLDDMANKGLSAGTFEGSTWMPALQAVPGLTVRPFPTFDAMVQAVTSGQLDGALVDPVSDAWALKTNPDLGIEAASGFTLAGPTGVQPTSLAVAKTCADYTAGFNAALKTMKSDGTFNTLLEKWGMVPPEKYLNP
jgi:polar amino acid transport system substrate-binding protein